jgi:hypothetical protein
MDIDLVQALGAEPGDVSVQRITLYVPDKDREGRPIDQERWVNGAKELLTRMTNNEEGYDGGVTALPAADGGWQATPQEVIWEKTRMVYSFIRAESFAKGIPDLRRFLHAFGREANQGVVVFEFDGDFYRIRHYDSEEEPCDG